MNQNKNSLVIAFLFCFISIVACKANLDNHVLDVISYDLTIEPIISEETISGTLIINFQIAPSANSVIFNSGDLQIDKITGKNVIGSERNGGKLIIDLSERARRDNEITIQYHGNPKRGLLFNPELDHAYTVYFTSHWMVCNDLPGDKATLKLDIIVPKGKECVASGEFIERVEKEDKSLYRWHQKYESPSYTYGFAIGNFNVAEEKSGEVLFRYYSKDHSADELTYIFKETQNIMSFLEGKSGIEYYQSTYSQILIGDYYQEMSGFSVLKDTYGKLVMEDSTETNLITHELAHQWWGNRITCESWKHFWLNEAFATYMSAAYNEYRFGNEKYDSDINAYFKVYQDIKERNNDKPLVFEDWTNPTRDDRNIVYFKGAYVLHLLRLEIGNRSFWEGIKRYSQDYFGKSVKTIDFQKAMEESSGKDLNIFFNEWMY